LSVDAISFLALFTLNRSCLAVAGLPRRSETKTGTAGRIFSRISLEIQSVLWYNIYLTNGLEIKNSGKKAEKMNSKFKPLIKPTQYERREPSDDYYAKQTQFTKSSNERK